jgi:hypothetical protein
MMLFQLTLMYLKSAMIKTTHRPRQYECMRCINSKIKCELDFETMPRCGDYAEHIILVKCTEFVRRER